MTTGTFFFPVAIVITTGKKDTVVCLAGARSLLRPEKKDTVVCLAGARSLLRPEKKQVPVVCLAGALSLLRPENKKVPVPKPISHQNQKLTQQHNWKKGSSSPREAWAGSSSPREASVFVSP